MKISVKPLKGDPFDVDVQPEETVEALKAKIAAARPDMPPDLQKVVHSGKVLQDPAALQDCGVKEGDFVVIMMSKPKTAAPAEPAAPPAPPAPEAASAAATAPAAASAPASAESALVTGEGMESTISMLCDMGFPRDMVVRCLRAAFNNPDRAVEYLMNGIPANLQQMASGQPPAPPAPAAPAAPGAAGAAPAAPMPPMPPPGPPATGPLASLANHPLFNRLRMAVQQQPESLRGVLAHIQQGDPNMIALVAEHQDEFVRLLSQPMAAPAGMDPVTAMLQAAQAAGQAPPAAPGAAPAAPAAPAPPPAPPAPPAEVQLSAAENEAIQQLMSLGFQRGPCVEAFLACDRDPEMAASYLFSRMED